MKARLKLRDVARKQVVRTGHAEKLQKLTQAVATRAAVDVVTKLATFRPIQARDGTVDRGLTTTKAILTFGRR
jgi:hypothetical protein